MILYYSQTNIIINQLLFTPSPSLSGTNKIAKDFFVNNKIEKYQLLI